MILFVVLVHFGLFFRPRLLLARRNLIVAIRSGGQRRVVRCYDREDIRDGIVDRERIFSLKGLVFHHFTIGHFSLLNY